jgi:two-component system sensor histidine kinase RegB
MARRPSFEDNDPLHIALDTEGLGGVGAAFGRQRLRTFIALRWVAVCGQSAAVLFVAFVLQYDLPLALCLSVIAASAWLNIFLMLVYPVQRLANEREAAIQLGYDILQVSLLIALTGGLSNPFLIMVVAPVTVAAATMRAPYAAALALLGLSMIALMGVFSLPLPWVKGEALVLPVVYQFGQFAAVAIGLAFSAASAYRVSRDEARLVRALDAAQAVLTREQRLSALGAMAAATAHELGTPLATIHLVSAEMSRGLADDHPLKEDADLLVAQAERCRGILRQLSRRGEAGDLLHARMPLKSLLEEVASGHARDLRRVNIMLQPPTDANGQTGTFKPPVLRRRPEILHGLGALVENAGSFSIDRVTVIGRWTEDEIEIEVADDGPGFSDRVLPRLGEPYLSERGEGSAAGGMGLGFFIAKTLLERTGARIKPFNLSAPEHGAVVRVTWPRQQVEAFETI